MALNWLPREDGLKDHDLWGDEFFGTEAPSIVYENRPVVNPQGQPIEGLCAAWITLNNPAQYNSYTTKMVKGITAGLQKASMDRNIVAVVITGVGEKSFCSGGNTKEYAEYYSKRPAEYGFYMDLFNGMIDGILNCKKPVICRVNGMRVAGGQEVGMACDISLSSDLAVYGQAGPRHGSAPVGGATDFLPWALSIEDAMWSCISCEMWSAYKMKAKGLLSKVVPVLKQDGKWLRNPLVITDEYVRDGEIVYGEMKTGAEADAAKQLLKSAQTDFELLDKSVNDIVWTFANLFPNCLQVSVEGVRQKKKFFWDMSKTANRHWLALNMNAEAFAGFNAFNTRKLTGQDVIDFAKFRELEAEGHPMNDELFEAVLGKPK
ncbi:MAG: 6-oxocyclohex-1-ene-1-carbonyl-CoA hydrolase [Chloroflexi bacterium RBG_16_56_8]|nr:MAG: 6-oxocyclohex-1-ene-1-carbonyl-CoA hydrolase [Chloroflexi bacterium RBG_16_56_8]